MTEKELRIGNIVNDRLHREVILKEIREEHFIFYLTNGSKIKHNVKTFNAIELNKDWFNKLGMTYYSLPTKSNINIGYYTIKCGNKFKINSSDDNYSFINFKKKIKYVHELQNLYFALIGEELTINK
tara:strand:- start:322 stop:702 length:381 start_codon:yes stop_codon:yes gene_type:complete